MGQGSQQPGDPFIWRKAVELALLRAGIPLATLKVMSEMDVWIYYFLLRKQDETEQANAAAEAQARAARR